MAENARTSPPPTHVWMQFYAELNTTSFAFSFHFFGTFPSYISRQFNAAFSILRCYLLCFIQMQFINSFNQGIALIVPVFTTFLQLKYQGNDQKKNPFTTHPQTMIVAVSSSVVYYLAYIALLIYPLRRFTVVAHHCLVSSGFASVASLASILLPDSLSPFVYAVFALLSAGELLHWLYHKVLSVEEDGAEFQVPRRRVRRFLNNNIWRVLGNSSAQRLQILPI